MSDEKYNILFVNINTTGCPVSKKKYIARTVMVIILWLSSDAGLYLRSYLYYGYISGIIYTLFNIFSPII